MTSLNDGWLTATPPEAAEAPDSFVYDPGQPTPSLLIYPELGPRDHRTVERGVLTYTSAALDRELLVVGPVMAVLFALSSARDTDWVVRLCDVWPDGRRRPALGQDVPAAWSRSTHRREYFRR